MTVKHEKYAQIRKQKLTNYTRYVNFKLTKVCCTQDGQQTEI